MLLAPLSLTFGLSLANVTTGILAALSPFAAMRVYCSGILLRKKSSWFRAYLGTSDDYLVVSRTSTSSAKMPPISTVSARLYGLVEPNRLKWRIVLADAPDPKVTVSHTPLQCWLPATSFSLSKIRTHFRSVPCKTQIGDLDPVLFNMHMAVIQNVVYNKFKVRSVIPALARIAFREIRDGNFVYPKSDKDGGFACVLIDDFGQIKGGILSIEDYIPLRRSLSVVDDTIDEFRSLCASFVESSRHDHDVSVVPKIKSGLMRDFRYRRPSDIISNLSLRVKTHRDDGCVVARPIHASTRNLFKPAMRMIAMTI